MTRTAIINQKGGVGKTTTTVNLGVALSRLHKKVLLIDLDPQAHLTLHLGVDPGSTDYNSYTLLTRHHGLEEACHQLDDRLWMMPAHIDLAAAETELVSVIGRETILRDALAECHRDIDYILMDCPPSLGILTLNGLCATDDIIIPMQAHFLALQGVSKLLETILQVQSRISPQLTVRGVLLCMHDASTRLGCEVVQDLKTFFDKGRSGNTPWSNARILDTVIRRNIKLAECPSHGQSIFEYAPKSNGAVDYQLLAEELLKKTAAGEQPDSSFTVKLASSNAGTPDNSEPGGAIRLAHTG